MVKPKKVLHSSETVQGGVGIYMRILSGMAAEDVEQVFLIPSGQRAHLLEGDPRIRVYPQEKRGLSGVWRQARHIRRITAEEKPDLIFLHSSFTLLSLLLLRLRGLEIPVLYCSHGWAVSRYTPGSLKARLVAQAERLLSALPDKVVNISRYDLELAKSLRYGGTHGLLENAVPDAQKDAKADLFEGEPDCLHLLFVGRLDRQKGLDLLLKAFERATQTRDDLRLHIVGESVRADDGEAVPVSDKVRFVGWVDNAELDHWYRSADALVVPSRWEGFGLVVAEAMRNGTPAVCSDRGALPSLIEEGRTGHIFPLEEDAIADRLETLDRATLRDMRDACRTTYEARFAIDRFYLDLLETYRSLQRA